VHLPNAQNRLPLQFHPSGQIQGLLFQAPYPFRKLKSAIQWINTKLGSLPYSRVIQEKEYYCDYVIIQCAPGLYGPILGGKKFEIDKFSGLPWNGEEFPIMLPDRVCIQGTSALSTIFDARCYEEGAKPTSVFSIDPGKGSEGWSHTFIDGITIRGARGASYQEPHLSTSTVPPGAGVFIGEMNGYVGQIGLIVSNCFITNNTIGVAVNTHTATPHHPVLINNTIAWNAVGVWAGSNCRTSKDVSPGPNPVFINNIFDSSSPVWRNFPAYSNLIAGVSGFEGIVSYNLTITNWGPGSESCSWDTNAYEFDPNDNSRRRVVLSPGWVSPSLRVDLYSKTGWPSVGVSKNAVLSGQGNSPLHPAVDIGPYTGLGTQNVRGVLYINDVMAKAPNLPSGYDRSPHDFRLAPYVMVAGQESTPYPDILNPLVDAGRKPQGSNLPLVFSNVGVTVGIHVLKSSWGNGCPDKWIPPGVPSGERHPWYSYQNGIMYWDPPCVTDYATFNAVDQDCEGFGNPRIMTHPWFHQGVPPEELEDIGADEMGDLIIAGYVYNTTVFSKTPSGRAPSWGLSLVNHDNTKIYFFGKKGQSNPRPNYFDFFSNSLWNSSNNPYQPYDWWRFLWRFRAYLVNGGIPNLEKPCPNWVSMKYIYYNNPNDPTSGTLYMVGEYDPLSSIYSFRGLLVTAYNLPPFPGNLVTDISPHLIKDIHPDWGAVAFSDGFACNPWFFEANYPQYDNPFMYYTRDNSDITVGVLNPPETWQDIYGWYLRYVKKDSNGVPLLFDPSNQGRSTFQVGSWGFGDFNGGFDPVPYTTQDGYARGWRVNCQLPYPGGWNLQSFLGINWPEGGANSSSWSQGGSFTGSNARKDPDPMELIRKGVLERKARK